VSPNRSRIQALNEKIQTFNIAGSHSELLNKGRKEQFEDKIVSLEDKLHKINGNEEAKLQLLEE
jgi:hypothetical protein